MNVSSPHRSAVDPRTVRIGIEAEFALVDAAGRFADFRFLTFAAAQAIVDRLDPSAHPALHRGDLGIKSGRWYVEGDERFDRHGRFLDCIPKGIEARTPPAVGIDDAVAVLARQTRQLRAAAAVDGYWLCSIGWNPFAAGYRPEPAYNGWERALHEREPVYLAPDAYMMSYGPDINLSHPTWDDDDVMAIGRRLTALSPWLVPFAFSAPFACGARADCWSVRTARRTGRRPAARVFVGAGSVPKRQPYPPLICRARAPSERGRIEFKAFDAVVDPSTYPALVALVVGVALSAVGGVGADVPDQAAHRTSAAHAFADPQIASGARVALAAAREAVRGSGYERLLDPLDLLHTAGRTPAHDLVDRYEAHGVVPLPLVATA